MNDIWLLKPPIVLLILEVKVWDQAGHLTRLTTNLLILNAQDILPPSVTITVPTVAVDSVSIGQNLIIEGTMQETGGLVQRGRIQIRNEFSRNIEDWSIVQLDSLFQGTVQVDTFIPIPAGTAPGNYTLELFGTDFVQNTGRDTARFYIKN